MLYRKAMQANDVNVSRVLQKMEVERLKGRLVSQACNYVIQSLNKITGYGDCRIVKSDASGLSGTRLFSGTLKVTARVADKGNVKTLEIPIEVGSSSLNLPKLSIIASKLAEIVVEDTLHKSVGEKVVKQLKDIQAKADAAKKTSEDAAAKRAADREEKGKEVILPGSTSGASAVPQAQVSKELIYSKAMLPANLVAGDIIPLSGRRYKLTEAKSNMQAGVSTDWILVLQES